MSDIWSWNNAVDAAGTSLTSLAGSAGALAVSRIRDPRVGKFWRSGGTPNELRIALPASAGISVVGLFGMNMADLGEVTVHLGTSAGSGNVWEGAVSATTALGRKAVFVIRDELGQLAPVTASHLTVRAAGTTPMEIGRVWAGGADWHTRVGHVVNGSEWQVIDLSTRRMTAGSGAFLIDRKARRDTFTPAYDALYPEEYADTLRRMDRDRGLASQMLFVPDPDVYDPHHWSILGYLRELPANRFLGFERGGRTMTIVEAG